VNSLNHAEHHHKWEYLVMEIKIPEMALVLLIGPSGAGKSSFAKKYFGAYEVISSDLCRAWVSNDENSMEATNDAFDVLHYLAAKRLAKGLLTVIDATNVQESSRKGLIKLARQFHVLPVAIVLNIPIKICQQRNNLRENRNFGKHVIRNQSLSLKRSLKRLKREGFRSVHVFNAEEEVNALININREPLYSNRKQWTGPFDIIGDIHGCYEETIALLEKLDYQISTVADDGHNYGIEVLHPDNRQVIFLGDLVDRGPDSPAVLKLVMSMVQSGIALCVPGNHDIKLHKHLRGKKVSLNHGLEETVAQLANESDSFILALKEFLYSLTSHYVLDHGNLVVAHAGLKEEMQGRGSGAVRAFCLYGETTGEIDEFGLPIRYNWAMEYKGKAKVVYGHTAVPRAEWLNNTIDVDTGCVFGGALTALRYPEEVLVSVPAKQVYCEPKKPLDESHPLLNNQQTYDDLLNIDDVIGKRIIQTGLRNNITIKEENAIAALEVMSRFAINPKWLIYLPPTMSPCASSNLDQYLEHPTEVFDYYEKNGQFKVIAEEKHMGSRAIAIICKDDLTKRKRFGIEGPGIGICYTRTGRNFFQDKKLEQLFLKRVQSALTKADFWKKFNSDWICMDCELMPWSAKAISLLKNQYAAVGAAASHGLKAVNQELDQLKNRGIQADHALLEKFSYKKDAVGKFKKAYRNYCWEVNSIDDYQLAPFHILATEGAVHVNKDHAWHMHTIAELAEADKGLFVKTNFKIIDLKSEDSKAEAIAWWKSMTKKGGEGMVVKPMDFIAKNKQQIIQPAIKCRGAEYLRIIYGPDYDSPDHLIKLRKRGLSRKRSLAIREFALGIESLERFVNEEPLRRVHEVVFGVLALESEEVDPRL